MKLFFHAFLTVIASLALCIGCSTEVTNPSNTDTSISNPDGGGSDGGSNDTGNPSSDIKLLSGEGLVTINALTPDNLPATIYFCAGSCYGLGSDPFAIPTDPWKVSNDATKASFTNKALVKGGIDWSVRILRPNYAFADWTAVAFANADGKTINEYTQTWTEPGSWGLALNKTNCLDSIDGDKKNITTSVKNGKVTLKVGTSDFEAWITDHTIVATDATKANGFDLTGTISENGSVISYHWTNTGSSSSGDATLTCP